MARTAQALNALSIWSLVARKSKWGQVHFSEAGALKEVWMFACIDSTYGKTVPLAGDPGNLGSLKPMRRKCEPDPISSDHRPG